MLAVAELLPTDRALAEALGVTVRTVRNWKKRGVPKEAGGYDLEKVKDWRADETDRALRARSQNQPKPPEEAPKRDPREENVLVVKRVAEAKLANTKASIADLELRVKRGELFETAEHIRIFTELIYMLRRRLDELLRTVPEELHKATKAKQKKRWEEEFDLLLEDLSARGE